jgi:hypothetical protein
VSKNVFTFSVGWAIEVDTFVSGTTFGLVDEFFSFSEFITDWFLSTFFSVIFASDGSVGVTVTWSALISDWSDWSDWVLNIIMFTVSASAGFVFTTAFVGVSSFGATGFAFFVFTFEFQESALFGVTNTSLFRTAFIESFSFWFVTGGAKSVWVVFWEGFFTFDSDTFTSVMFATSGGEFWFVDELLTLLADMVFIKTTALSEGSDIFTSGNTVIVTAAWHADVVVLVPFVSDWIISTFVDTVLFWAVTFLFSTSTSSGGFDSLNSTVAWADWVFDGDWTVFFTFTSVNFATFFGIDEFTSIKFFFFGTNWNWAKFVWEHSSTFIWVLFVGTFTNVSTSPTDAALSPVIYFFFFFFVTNWSFWASGSFVETNSLIVVVHVEVVAGKTEPIFVKSIISFNFGLTVAPLVTIASFTHVVSVSESVVGREFIGNSVMLNFTNIFCFTIYTDFTTVTTLG